MPGSTPNKINPPIKIAVPPDPGIPNNKVGINAYPYVGPLSFGPSYISWLDDPLPGVTGIPISPSFPANSIWSPTVPYTPVLSPTGFVPTIVTLR